jgi:hypothetical protein
MMGKVVTVTEALTVAVTITVTVTVTVTATVTVTVTVAVAVAVTGRSLYYKTRVQPKVCVAIRRKTIDMCALLPGGSVCIPP